MNESGTEVPVPLCLLLADRVYQDAETGNCVIAGTFNTIFAARFPSKHPQMSIFFQITGVSKPVDLRLRIEHAEDGESVMDVGGPIQAQSPLEVIAKKIRLQGLPLRRPGKYWVQLKSGEEILIQAPWYAILLPRAEEGGSNHEQSQRSAED